MGMLPPVDGQLVIDRKEGFRVLDQKLKELLEALTGPCRYADRPVAAAWSIQVRLGCYHYEALMIGCLAWLSQPENHVSALDFLFGAADPDRLYFVVRFAQARRVDEQKRDSLD